MQRLFLDLASHNALIACVTDHAVAASQSLHARIGDHELIPLVESVLEKAGWSYEDIEGIACVVGPGGFTSLRIAVTYANVLADQLGIPLVGIHLSDVYRMRVGNEEVYWLHSTKKDQLFVRGGTWNESTLISIDEMPAGPWMGELIEEHQSIIGTDAADLKPINDVLPALLAKQSYDTKPLTPWYGRGW